jgi:hypothetical protein
VDIDTIKMILDVGGGGLALLLYSRHGKILANHEERITVLEAKAPRRKKTRANRRR